MAIWDFDDFVDGSSHSPSVMMTSEEAKALTRSSRTRNYKSAMDRVYSRIYQAADAGLNKCTFLTSSIDLIKDYRGIATELRSKGYTVKEHREYVLFGSICKLTIEW